MPNSTASEDPADDQTIERESFAQRRRLSVEPFSDGLTPLPGLPGEGPVSVGSDPSLDDAWTLDRGLESSSWPKPEPASGQSLAELPTMKVSPVDASSVAPLIIEELPSPGDARDGYSADAKANFHAVPEPPSDDADTGKHIAARHRDHDGDDDSPEVQLTLDDFDSITPEPGKLPEGMIDPLRPRASTAPPIPVVGENPMGVRLNTQAGSSDEALLEALTGDDDDDDLSFIELSKLDRLAQDLLGNLDDGAPPDESDRARLKRRISALIERGKAEHQAGNLDAAVMALDLAVAENPDSAITQKLIHLHSDDICEVYQTYIGDASAVPSLAVDMGDLARENIDSRAAFLISRLDGAMSIDELLDVAGMPRLEAYRHLCILRLKELIQFD